MIEEYDPQTFWQRNWEIAEHLGEPTPPALKLDDPFDVPIYCSETNDRACDRGFKCFCGCTEYLRLQKRLKKANNAKQRRAELSVAGIVPSKAWGKIHAAHSTAAVLDETRNAASQPESGEIDKRTFDEWYDQEIRPSSPVRPPPLPPKQPKIRLPWVSLFR